MSEIKFKVGDKVTCIDASGWAIGELTLNRVYEVLEVGQSEIFVRSDKGIKVGTYATRFTLHLVTKTVATSTKVLTLPTDSNERKDYPVLSGCVKYFPAALAGVSRISKLGNDKHNPGQPLHHARGKSMDHGDCIIRHLIDTEDLLAAFNRGDASITKEQILLEANQLAWRALAYSQMINELFGAPLAPGAK